MPIMATKVLTFQQHPKSGRVCGGACANRGRNCSTGTLQGLESEDRALDSKSAPHNWRKGYLGPVGLEGELGFDCAIGGSD